jgi:hypothetical protein
MISVIEVDFEGRFAISVTHMLRHSKRNYKGRFQ